MMKELHDQGKTIDEIEQVLKRVPVIPRVVAAIKAAHTFGYVYAMHIFYGFFGSVKSDLL